MLPLYNQLHQVRKVKRVSQKILAEQVGLSRAHLSDIEHEKVDVRMSNFCALARALDLEVMLIPKHLLGEVALLLLNQAG
jgi:transcriptional regulator with XRE-family HTH domain